MFKAILSFVFLIFLNLDIQADEFDFRKVQWGMEKQQVKASEKSKPIKEADNYLIYSLIIGKIPAFLTYVFSKESGQLTLGKYIFRPRKTKSEQYVYDYQKLKRILQKKYSNPLEDRMVWKNKKYKNSPGYWGQETKQK